MVSKLNAGPSDLPWMSSAYGWIFMGFEVVTDADIQALMDYRGSGGDMNPNLDEKSFPGRLAREYTAEIWERNETTTPKLGGEGSQTYMTQKIIGGEYGGGDIGFRPEDDKEIWHINPDGDRVYGILDYPRTLRGFHIDEYGQTAAGPKAGSNAENRLGDGYYQWDEENQWYLIKGKNK